jgi:hypothetical protein
MGTYYYVRFAQAYGQDSYNMCIYNDTTACSTSGGGTSGTPSGGANAPGGLSNTGLMILVIVSAACLVVFCALVVRFWRRPRKELARETVPNDENDDTPTDSNAV